MKINSPVWDVNAQGGSLKESRGFAYQSKGKVLKNKLSHQEKGHYLEFMLESDQEDAIYLTVRSDSKTGKTPRSFPQVLASAEGRWQAWFSAAPPVLERYQRHYYYAWWVIGNNFISPNGHIKREAMMPSKAKYVGVWNWDACFHALALRHIDHELAKDQLRGILDWQMPNGMIPDAIFDEGIVNWIDHPIPGEVTKPPVIAWTALKLHQSNPDAHFLAEIYPALVRWNAWWFDSSQGSDHLAQYNHPYSSGADDNPLWDHGMPVISPDLNTYLAVQMEALAEIAAALGKPEAAEKWGWRAAALVEKMVTELYDPEAGLFWAHHNRERIPETTLFNLYPLWTAKLGPQIQAKLLAHLTNPEAFWGARPLTTVARNNPSFSPDTMWRGPVWMVTNYIFIEALARVGQPDLAKKLRDQTLALVGNCPGMHEYYNPDTGEPAQKAAPMFGWTAALYIDLAIQASQKGGK
jgi:glycogen debranching enzyme